MYDNDAPTFDDFRQIFSWQNIKQQPIRGVVLACIFIVIGSLSVEVTNNCITAFTAPIEIPHTSNHWQITKSDFEAEIRWQVTSDLKSTDHPPYVNANQQIASAHGNVFYLWSGGHISGFPCYRDDKRFLTYDLQSGELINQYAGKETSDLRSIIPTKNGFAVVSYDHALTQFDTSGNFVWTNQQFFSRSIKNVFETDDLYYLPTRWETYVVEKSDGHKHHGLSDSNVIAVYEDIMLVSSDGNVIQVVEREGKILLNTFNFPKTTDGFGYAPFVKRSDNLLILTQLQQQVRAYDLDTQAFTWTIDVPFVEHEYPKIFQNAVVLYDSDQPSLEFYDLQSGDYIGQIQLDNTASDIAPKYVDIGVDSNIITIFFQNTHDIVTLEVDFPIHQGD